MKKNMSSDTSIDAMFVLLFGSMLVSAAFFPMKLLAEINNNNPVQFTEKANVSALHDNCTRMTNASATTPQEVHKPLTPKSSQEIQKEKEDILKSKLNTSVFTQQLANPR